MLRHATWVKRLIRRTTPSAAGSGCSLPALAALYRLSESHQAVAGLELGTQRLCLQRATFRQMEPPWCSLSIPLTVVDLRGRSRSLIGRLSSLLGIPSF